MRFSVDIDLGPVINGWLAPDNPLETPSLLVRLGPSKELLITKTHHRADVMELGLHATGMVGFYLGPNEIPGLENEPDVEILEAKSKTPIYSRFNKSKHTAEKIALFDVAITNQSEFDLEMKKRFALCYPAAHRNSLESLMMIINNKQATSAFLSGALNYNKYVTMLRDADFKIAAICREPFEHMAETLCFLHALNRADDEVRHFFGEGVCYAARFIDRFALDDDKALAEHLKQLPPDLEQMLVNPQTRMFGSNQEDPVRFENVPMALDQLARMDLVGASKFPEVFQESLKGLLGVPEIPSVKESYTEVGELAFRLRRIAAAVKLIDFDVVLYSLVERSIERAATDTKTV